MKQKEFKSYINEFNATYIDNKDKIFTIIKIDNRIKFFVNIKLNHYIWILLFFKKKLHTMKLLKYYLNLKDILNLKIRNLQKNDLQMFNLHKLLLCKNDDWIIVVNNNLSDDVRLKLQEILISKVKSGGRIKIYSKSRIFKDIKGDDFEYNFFKT